jgi:hypothetical protein
MRQDVGTLDGLREETKNIVYDEQSTFRVLGSRGVRLHAFDGRVLALLLIAIGDDGRDCTAGFALGGCHCGEKSALKRIEALVSEIMNSLVACGKVHTNWATSPPCCAKE